MFLLVHMASEMSMKHLKLFKRTSELLESPFESPFKSPFKSFGLA